MINIKFCIGVDGGGTKSHIILFDNDGKVLDELIIGCTNQENLRGGLYEACATINSAAERLLQKNKIDKRLVNQWIMGLAGIDTESQLIEFKEHCSVFNIKQPYVCNDGYLPLYAGTDNGIGVTYASGTGSVAGGINERGDQMQLGCFWNYSGDIGYGSWIYESIWAAAYSDRFLGCAPTIMTQMMENVLSLPFTQAFNNEVFSKINSKESKYHEVIKILFQAWDLHDEVALAIGNSMINRCLDLIKALIARLNFSDNVDVVLSGSIHQHAASNNYLLLLEKELLNVRVKSTQIRSVSILSSPPVLGCIKLSRML